MGLYSSVETMCYCYLQHAFLRTLLMVDGEIIKVPEIVTVEKSPPIDIWIEFTCYSLTLTMLTFSET